MQVKITTGERKAGLLGGSVETYLKCQITLTPEEQAILPHSGNPVRMLTTTYNYEDGAEFQKNYGGILFERATQPGGDEHIVRNHGQLQEIELECLKNCRVVQGIVDRLKGYDVEKSYVLDLEEESAQEN